MTDYKALYEQQLAENKELKEEIECLNRTAHRNFQQFNDVMEKNQKLRDEVRDLKKLIEYRNQMDKLERKMLGKDID